MVNDLFFNLPFSGKAISSELIKLDIRFLLMVGSTASYIQTCTFLVPPLNLILSCITYGEKLNDNNYNRYLMMHNFL